MKLRTLLATAAVLAVTAAAHAAVPAEITDMTTNAETVFTSVKALIVAVVGFTILIGFAKMAKKR